MYIFRHAQRLVSLDTLLRLGDRLRDAANGKLQRNLLAPLAGQLMEFQMPKPLLSAGDRNAGANGIYDNRHIRSETQTDIAKMIRSSHSPKDLAGTRGRLVPYLRDTLVGLNYAYYAPPGAQMLHNDSLFVRAHDFLGDPGMDDQAWQTPEMFGQGFPTSGGAHLAGSLANLPYVLANVEQNFIVPENVQALIWEDLVPSLLASAVVPRWWQVTPNELRAVALYQRCGEELLRAASQNSEVRQRVIEILSIRMLPARAEAVAEDLLADHPAQAISQVTPGDVFYLAVEYRKRFPKGAGTWGQAGQELNVLVQRYPKEVSLKRLSRDFGVPHPAIRQTYTCGLLNTKPFPTYMGYSSRLLAESWDSNNLYWARLADENGYPPVMLNLLAPKLTRLMVENIFATYLGDWPALLRALQETGEEFQEGKSAALPKPGSVPQL